MKDDSIKALTILKSFQTSQGLESPKSMTVVSVDDENPLILFTVWYEICRNCVHNGYVQTAPTYCLKRSQLTKIIITSVHSLSEKKGVDLVYYLTIETGTVVF